MKKYKPKKSIGKYGIKSLKRNQAIYLPIDKHDSVRSLCSYYKRAHGLKFHVNKAIDSKGNECIAVTPASEK